MSTTNLVSDFRTNAETRIKELRPQVDEYESLVEALSALDKPGNSSSPSTSTATPEKPRQRTSRGDEKRAGRSPERANQFLKIVGDNPGITTGAVAKKMGIKPNYLYRVGSVLVKEGRLVKEGTHFRLP